MMLMISLLRKTRKKMSAGIPLKDNDRFPWILKIRNNIHLWNVDMGAVLAFPDLKQSYLDRLTAGSGRSDIIFVT